MMKPVIGISIGDINGIGPEVIIKTLADARILEQCTPVIYGSTKVLSYHKNIVKPSQFEFHGVRDAENVKKNRINVVNVWAEDINIELGKGTEASGKFAYTSLDRATQDLKKGLLHGMVTAPINKHVMNLAGFPYPGHTEYLEAQFDGQKSLMLMVNDALRIGVVTNHLPLSEVIPALTKSLVLKKTKALHECLKVDLGIGRPRIALLGVNPHAGDSGTLGDDEDHLIRPVISELSNKGLLVTGPHPADGFFGAGHHRQVDGVMAMYHDQGLIPFKTLSFGSGVNYTAGLPIVRTSPDHGTAFDIAGQNIAEPQSFRNALFLAIDVIRNRKQHQKLQGKTLEREELGEDTGEDDIIREEIENTP